MFESLEIIVDCAGGSVGMLVVSEPSAELVPVGDEVLKSDETTVDCAGGNVGILVVSDPSAEVVPVGGEMLEL